MIKFYNFTSYANALDSGAIKLDQPVKLVGHGCETWGLQYEITALRAEVSRLTAANATIRAEAVREAGMAWNDPKEYRTDDDLVQVLCEVTMPQTSDFPRSCEMPVSSGDHGVDDSFVSIGHANEDGEWFVAGWEMTQDCWVDARCFTVRGWQPLALIDHPAPAAEPMSVAARDVLAERARQINAEGWSPEKDDLYVDGELAAAAACYAISGGKWQSKAGVLLSMLWPWARQWFKPTGLRRDLVKSGALLIAEIERLDRAAEGSK